MSRSHALGSPQKALFSPSRIVLFNNCLEPQVYCKKQSHETVLYCKIKSKGSFHKICNQSLGKQLLFSFLKDIMQLAAEHVFPLGFLSLGKKK